MEHIVTTNCRYCRHIIEVSVQVFNYRQSASCRDAGRECPMEIQPKRKRKNRRRKDAATIIFHQGGTLAPSGIADQVALAFEAERARGRIRAY